MKDILNRRSVLHWFNLLEIFLSHKNSKRFCWFCDNFPGYIQNPVWNNSLNQTGSHCPALGFAWPDSGGRPQGSLLWFSHLLSCLSTAQPPSRFTKAPALSCHLETHSLPLTTGKIPVLSQAPPPAGWQGDPLTLKQSQGQTCSISRVALRRCTTEENLTLKKFQNQHLPAPHIFAFCR